jgi:FtsP/CotA-like multicopper oxidase with cupredoxin domain
MEEMSMDWDGPAAAMLGIVDTAAGTATHRMWMDAITENPAVGETEIWEFYNFTADAHPMHIHEVVFEVVDRQQIEFMEGMHGPSEVALMPGTNRPPEPWETGFKDTVIAYPGEVTRVRAQFTNPGQFVWHCHIVSHEDNEMMRPFRVGPAQPGQPA